MNKPLIFLTQVYNGKSKFNLKRSEALGSQIQGHDMKHTLRKLSAISVMVHRIVISHWVSIATTIAPIIYFLFYNWFRGHI